LIADENKHTLPVANRPAADNSTYKPKPAPAASKTQIVDWPRVQKLYNQDETIQLQVTGFNRGGLLVKGDWLQGFVPASHLVSIDPCAPEPNREPMLAAFVGRTLRLKVIECNPDRGRVVFSERAAQAAEGCRNQLFEMLHIGDQVKGVVTNVTDFGVFVDLGGIEGLIHVSELSWGRVRHPADIATMGEMVTAQVISLNPEQCRIALSLKRLFPNPWETAENRYHPGEVNEAVITSVTTFGAFARLEPGLDGLIHVTEMCPASDKIDPAHVVREGQRVRVRVLSVDATRQRLGLSLISEQ
jgi:small subunit ribosomal protein S1